MRDESAISVLKNKKRMAIINGIKIKPNNVSMIVEQLRSLGHLTEEETDRIYSNGSVAELINCLVRRLTTQIFFDFLSAIGNKGIGNNPDLRDELRQAYDVLRNPRQRPPALSGNRNQVSRGRQNELTKTFDSKVVYLSENKTYVIMITESDSVWTYDKRKGEFKNRTVTNATKLAPQSKICNLHWIHNNEFFVVRNGSSFEMPRRVNILNLTESGGEKWIPDEWKSYISESLRNGECQSLFSPDRNVLILGEAMEGYLFMFEVPDDSNEYCRLISESRSSIRPLHGLANSQEENNTFCVLWGHDRFEITKIVHGFMQIQEESIEGMIKICSFIGQDLAVCYQTHDQSFLVLNLWTFSSDTNKFHLSCSFNSETTACLPPAIVDIFFTKESNTITVIFGNTCLQLKYDSERSVYTRKEEKNAANRIPTRQKLMKSADGHGIFLVRCFHNEIAVSKV